MTPPPFFHGMFTLNRTWKTTPARVFSAWSDPQMKAQWFAGPSDSWTLIRRSMDVRTGGSELVEGRFDAKHLTTRFEARYHLVEQDRRIVYSYDLHLGETFHSVTLASLLIEPAGRATRVSYTEQIVFLDGTNGTEIRRSGTEPHFDAIAKLLGVAGGES